MKVYVTSPNENWILDRIKAGWIREKPSLNAEQIKDSDLIWFLDSYSWKSVPYMTLKNKKVVASVHHVVPDKFNENDFKMRDTIVDAYHVPCDQTKDFISNFTSKPIEKIGYWCESQFWTPYSHDEAKKQFKLTDKYVVGSFQRDTEGSDLKTPKLEKGPDLFCDYIARIKDKHPNLHVLLGGWRRQYVISRLEQMSVPYTYYERSPLENIRKMYAACNLYVVSSRYEGGPQALLEASLMKIPIISTNMGMAKDVLSKNCLVDITKDYYVPTEKDIEVCYDKAIKFALKTHVNNYEAFLVRTMQEQ